MLIDIFKNWKIRAVREFTVSTYLESECEALFFYFSQNHDNIIGQVLTSTKSRMLYTMKPIFLS